MDAESFELRDRSLTDFNLKYGLKRASASRVVRHS